MKPNQYDRFKRLLIQYLKEHSKVCSTFIESVRKTKTPSDLMRLMRNNADEVAEHLGYGPDWDECPECDKKENQILKLEERLEDVYRETRKITLEDEYKAKAFGKYSNNYSSAELEYLLEHGKTLLKNNYDK